ncbi:MAG: hypothetical protein OQK94_02450 [Gammaproteobacteria bacterium]|nr:hypothetical protein [Gammaproteobacteria bacterium]MCW8841020.1 hypothetical protein [Gammaproteobacteria bacterium]MCW8958835.1 hypothetical protein [Gammaproteobacteria bacterium]MCW8972015.1 hypothetical protein [Gammaproteobacteria bacterium]MCW8991944.1 hypothetical protein [Gammaproteobacteria bacterium]
MQRVLQAIIVMCCLVSFSALYAQETSPAEQLTIEAQADEKGDGEQKGWSGMTIFWLVFAFSVLFLISSATALNRLGGKPPPIRKKPETRPRSKANESRGRFRL